MTEIVAIVLFQVGKDPCMPSFSMIGTRCSRRFKIKVPRYDEANARNFNLDILPKIK